MVLHKINSFRILPFTAIFGLKQCVLGLRVLMMIAVHYNSRSSNENFSLSRSAPYDLHRVKDTAGDNDSGLIYILCSVLGIF